MLKYNDPHLTQSESKPLDKSVSRGTRWLWITAIVLILDQITKFLILKNFTFGDFLPITSFFNLTLAYNKGAAFSFLDGASGWQTWFFGVVALTISGVILVWLHRLPSQRRWFCIALSLVLAGALGNLTDRILYGHVIDFLDFYLSNWHWPVFNVADSAVCVGAFMLFVDAMRKR